MSGTVPNSTAIGISDKMQNSLPIPSIVIYDWDLSLETLPCDIATEILHTFRSFAGLHALIASSAVYYRLFNGYSNSILTRVAQNILGDAWAAATTILVYQRPENMIAGNLPDHAADAFVLRRDDIRNLVANQRYFELCAAKMATRQFDRDAHFGEVMDQIRGRCAPACRWATGRSEFQTDGDDGYPSTLYLVGDYDGDWSGYDGVTHLSAGDYEYLGNEIPGNGSTHYEPTYYEPTYYEPMYEDDAEDWSEPHALTHLFPSDYDFDDIGFPWYPEPEDDSDGEILNEAEIDTSTGCEPRLPSAVAHGILQMKFFYDMWLLSMQFGADSIPTFARRERITEQQLSDLVALAEVMLETPGFCRFIASPVWEYRCFWRPGSTLFDVCHDMSCSPTAVKNQLLLRKMQQHLEVALIKQGITDWQELGSALRAFARVYPSLSVDDLVEKYHLSCGWDREREDFDPECEKVWAVLQSSSTASTTAPPPPTSSVGPVL